MPRGTAPEGQIGDPEAVWYGFQRAFRFFNVHAGNDGNRAAAAKELEINPSTLYRKAKSLNIELPKAAGRDKSD